MVIILKSDILKIINNISNYKELTSSINKIDKMLIENNINIFKFLDEILKENKNENFFIMTFLIKKRKLYDIKYFSYYEKWLYEYVDDWGKCDAYCYRVLNPMIEKYLELYTNITNWSNSEKVYVRRASLVCFIISKKDFYIDYELNKIFEICDKLKWDKHIHIQKAVGWVLKYSYLTYQKEIEKYLRNNVGNLSRTSFRYALEKMPVELKDELMKL